MRLSAVLFKDEEVNGIYRAHFIVYVMGAEVTRFALEFKNKPSREELAAEVDQMLKRIAEDLPPPPEVVMFEKEI
jgi:hypothetical protein